MRTIPLAGWPHPVSALGFGCASLGSRISRKAGMAAIERALAAGITWFDVAPSYGDGEAEGILGTVLGGASVAIVTKVGLRAPATRGFARVARALARPLVTALPGLRSLIKPLRADAVARILLDGENIRASLSRSLERLKVDRVAVLALHDPVSEDLRRDDVLRALEDVKRQGLAARIGVAGSFDNFVVTHEARPFIDVAQFAVSASGRCSAQVGSLVARDAFVVTHSAFAATNSQQLRYAFGANPSGIVLASNFASEHLKANVAAASNAPDQAFAIEVERSLRGESGPRVR